MAPPVVHPARVMQPGYYGDQPNGICNVTPEEFLRAFETFHRHTCTHSQMTTPAQYRRMAAPGACANVFANHIWAWGGTSTWTSPWVRTVRAGTTPRPPRCAAECPSAFTRTPP